MLLDSKMMEMEPVLMFMKHVLMVTRMMELDNVFSNLQVVEITLLMTEMEIVLLSSNNTLLSSSCMTHQENPPDVTQLAQNVNLKDNVLPVKSVIP